MDTNTHKGTAEIVADLMADIGPHEVIPTPFQVDDGSKTHLIALPNHRQIQDVTAQIRANVEYLKPERRRGTAKIMDLASLIAWANRFKGDTSALFAHPDTTAPTMTCIANYHGSGPSDPSDNKPDAHARHCDHRAVYNFPLSEDWKAWTAISGKAMSKDQLGEFIQKRAFDIMDPTPGIIAGKLTDKLEPWEQRMVETAQKIEGRFAQLKTLLDLSKKFQIHETSNLTVKTNRDTGESEVQFLNEHKTPEGKPVNIPNLLMIAIPVFQGGAPYRMTVQFRYRKQGQEVAFFLTLFNPEKSFEAAFDEAVDTAVEATGLPVFRGTPEA